MFCIINPFIIFISCSSPSCLPPPSGRYKLVSGSDTLKMAHMWRHAQQTHVTDKDWLEVLVIDLQTNFSTACTFVAYTLLIQSTSVHQSDHLTPHPLIIFVLWPAPREVHSSNKSVQTFKTLWSFEPEQKCLSNRMDLDEDIVARFCSKHQTCPPAYFEQYEVQLPWGRPVSDNEVIRRMETPVTAHNLSC